VAFDGRQLSRMSLGQRNRYRNRRIGFVFQFYHLLPELNVLENTLLPALVGLHRWTYYGRIGQLRARASELLTAFGLKDRFRHRPRELSGGERQRVAIARALMNKPQILLADEPTGNLDERTGEEILDLIAEQYEQGLTIVMVTHDPAIARRADRIVHLHDGRIDEA
jgi:lipoprotein-releasing system ATP-binding protein